MTHASGSPAAALVARLEARGLTIAVAESLTGGLLADAFVSVPGASAIFVGGVVAYATPLKQALLGVDAALLAERGAVDADVAKQMAEGVRRALAIDGRPADIGLATTGVAGPDAQDGQRPGTVVVGVAVGDAATAVAAHLAGDRSEIRRATVALALQSLAAAIDAQTPVERDGGAE